MTVTDEDVDAYEAEIADVAGVLNLANAQLVEITERVLRDESCVGTGAHSLAQWLAYRAGVSPERAKAIVPVNDTHGHDTGDLLLQAVATALTTSTRPGDLVTRWGGDEFLVLCPGAEGEQLEHLALRMVNAVAEASVGDVRVGASAGTQSCRYRPLPMAAADKAMYAAKLAGGGRVGAVAPT